MKKWIVIFSLFCFSVQAQENEKEWIVFTGFDIYYTSFLNTGSTMTEDAHRKYANGFGFKLGAVEYKNMGLALFYNHTRNKINDITMIADFKHTRYNDFGLVLNYKIPLTEKSTLKPEIGYYSAKAKNVGEARSAINKDRSASYKGNGFLIGTEYLIFTSNNIALVAGIHYNYIRFNIDANPAYKNYFANAHRIQFKLGFHFGR